MFTTAVLFCHRVCMYFLDPDPGVKSARRLHLSSESLVQRANPSLIMVPDPVADPKESARDPEAGPKGSVSAPPADPDQSEIGLAAAVKEDAIALVVALKGREMCLESGLGVSPRVSGHVTDHVAHPKVEDPEIDLAVSQRVTGRDLERNPRVLPKGSTIVPEVALEVEGIVLEAVQTLNGRGHPIANPGPLPQKRMERRMPDPNHQ